MSKDEPHTRTRARQGLPVAERLLRRFTDAAQDVQVGRIQGLLEAQAHAQPDRQKLRLYAGEDAGSDRNVHTYADLRKDSMPPVRRVVHAPLFFPLREVHTVPSVWLSLNRFTTSHAGTVRELPVPESEK